MRAGVLSIAFVALVVAVVALTSSGGATTHRLTVVVDDATNTSTGQAIRAAGTRVGSITKVEPLDAGRKVRLSLELDDEVWPLPTGSKMALRWGGTASFDNRYIALTLGKRGAPPIRDGATLGRRDFQVPIELDSLLTAFTPGVRTDIRTFLANGGAAFKLADQPLRRTLERAPAALDQTRHVASDLVADRHALDVLLRQTDTSVDAVQNADPGLRRLLSGAAQTFTAISARQQELGQTLDAAPSTLRAARSTLDRLDPTLDDAAELTDALRPGVDQVQAIASPLNSALKRVTTVAPQAQDTLSTLRRATPNLNPLLGELTTQMPKLASIGVQAQQQGQCIRPYTPELTALLSDWAAFQSASDGRDKYFRANVIVPAALPTNVSPDSYDSEAAAQAFGDGFKYGNPYPPGALAGQPWYQPQCDIGPDNVDPAKDPESRK